MFVSAGWVSQPQAARGQAGKMSQKYHGAETPDHPAGRALFVLAAHTLPALPKHPGCSCLLSSQHSRLAWDPQFSCPCRELQAQMWAAGVGAAGPHEPKEDALWEGERSTRYTIPV